MSSPPREPLADPPRTASLTRPAPLLYPVLALMGGIALSDTLGPLDPPWRHGLLIVPLLGLVAVALPCVRRRRSASVSLVLGLAFCVGVARHQAMTYRPPNHVLHILPDEPVLTRVAGCIVTSPVERPAARLNPFLPFDPPPRTQFVLALRELRTLNPPVPILGTLRVNIEAADLDLILGQHVELTGKLYRPVRPNNPAEQDWSRWYAQQGIDAGLLVEGRQYVRSLPIKPAWTARLITKLRAAAHNLLFEPWADLDSDPTVRLLDTMVLGHRTAADRSINEAFLRAGGMHFLAVSGFNVSLLAATAWWVARRLLHRGPLTASLAALTLVLAFALVAEPNAPVLRATVATALATMATLLRRPVCFINWLAASAGFVLLINPGELFRPGFQLSFGLVLALVRLVPAPRSPAVAPLEPQVESLWTVLARRTGHALATLFLSCLVAWAVSLPLVLWHFQRVAPWGWLGTLLLTPLVTVVTVLSFFTLLSNALLPIVGSAAAGALHTTCGLLLWIVARFEHLPAAVVSTPRPPLWLVVATYALILVLDQIVRRRRRRANAEKAVAATPTSVSRSRKRGVAAAVGVVAAVLWSAWLAWLVWRPPQHSGEYTLQVLAVGNGSAAVLTTPDGRAVVVDVGTDTNSDAGELVSNALRSQGIRAVENVIVSHANFDHYSGLPTLLRALPTRRWMTNAHFAAQTDPHSPLHRLTQSLPPEHRTPGVLRAGDTLAVGGASVEVLWPPADLGPQGKINDQGLVLRVTCAGRSVLLPGDAERATLNALLAAQRDEKLRLKADVLVAPHHGQVLGGVTEAFYAAVAPRLVIVSTRTPRPRVARLVAEVLGDDVPVLETGRTGAVIVRIAASGELRHETPFAAQARPTERSLFASAVEPEADE
jgi:competence protein ComEC